MEKIVVSNGDYRVLSLCGRECGARTPVEHVGGGPGVRVEEETPES